MRGHLDRAVAVLAVALLAVSCTSSGLGDDEAEECFLSIAYDESSLEGDASRYGNFLLNMVSTFEYPDNPTQEEVTAVYAATIGIPVEEFSAFLFVSENNVIEQLGPTPTDPFDDPDGFEVWHEAWGRDFWKRWIDVNPEQAGAFCASYTSQNPRP